METLKLVFEAAWQVLLVGLVLGAGLPALFALGVRVGAGAEPSGADGAAFVTPSPAARALSALCFLVVLAGVAIGIMVIVGAGFGMIVSFEHGIPTLAPKP